MVTQNRLPQIAAFFVSALLIFSLTAAAQKKSPENKNTEPTAQVTAKPETETAEHEDPMFKGMKYRLVGPFRGGRSLTASGIPGDPTTYYFGATGGGVWKSTDGALTWKPVFEKENSPAIGSLAVAVSNPNIVYVGTGEACLRGNIAQGDGVYKTLDGGKTWKNVGLRDSRAIGKVIVNPTNPDIAFVAALGHPYGPNPERGNAYSSFPIGASPPANGTRAKRAVDPFRQRENRPMPVGRFCPGSRGKSTRSFGRNDREFKSGVARLGETLPARVGIRSLACSLQ
jgi:hypothetical protein